MQSLKEQTELLALVALAHKGSSKNARITKRISTIRYSYTKYWFDFSARVLLLDKQEKDKSVVEATVEMRIDDNLLVVTITSRAGRQKVLTQMNITTVTMLDTMLTIDSPTMYMEVAR